MSEIKYLRNEDDSPFITGMPLDASGGPIQLCVFHQINPDFELVKASSFVVGGVSTCVEHLDSLMGYVAEGSPMSEAIDALFEVELGL